MAGPITSGSKNGIDQPPCWNPPSRSSSAPPGACTTPSRLMNSLMTIRMPCRRWHSRELIADRRDERAPRRGEPVRYLGELAGGAAVQGPAVLGPDVLLAEIGPDRLVALDGHLVQPEPLLGDDFGAGDGVLLVQHDLVLLFGDGRPV